GSQLDVKQVADLAMAVCIVSNAIKLQIGITQARFSRFPAKLFTLGELNTVGGSLNAVVSELTSIADCLDKVRRHGRFAARKLNRHLPSRFDLECILHDFLNLFPAQFVDVSDLIGVHEAWVTHHVATVRQVNREYRTTTVFDCAGTVIM